MKPPKFVVYNGRKFWLQQTGRYYSDGRHGKKITERLLHRVIWRDRRGAIPAGMCVHHKNGNWQDNRMSNLTLIPRGEHSRNHLSILQQNPTIRAKLDAGLAKARVAAVHWHRSAEGRKWHSLNAKEQWKTKTKIPKTCPECQTVFQTFSSYPKEHCSNACWQRRRWRVSKVDRVCVQCGQTWKSPKYSKAKVCGQACANRKRFLDRRLRKPHKVNL